VIIAYIFQRQNMSWCTPLECYVHQLAKVSRKMFNLHMDKVNYSLCFIHKKRVLAAK